MSTTPVKSRVTGIPTPGRSSGIPTPGRARSTSSTGQYIATIIDDEFISRSFQDAIKANDPASHRPSSSNDVSLSPRSTRNVTQSGRQSVTGRPSSSASSSSALSSSISRSAPSAKPPMPRPSSRASDVFGRSVSRAGRTFDIGDNVRLESLGFEGVLRFLGEIEGKPGQFAGVELQGGFAGRGKNNGTFGGKRYFTCPPACGVFISADKLSPPTVGPGSLSRPSSVASVRNGRETPSSSRMPGSVSSTMSNGRKTPSLPNGRVTPVNGRMTPSGTGRRTPGTALPSTRARTMTMTPGKSTPGSSGITPGSRASRYVGITAKQLSSRKSGAESPTMGSVSSPTRSFGVASSSMDSAHFTSPTRNISSPFTPKAGRGSASNAGTPTRTRSFNTPRARIPSAVAMPPPPSPSTRSVSLNDPIVKPQRGSVDLNGHTRSTDSISGRMSSLEKTSRPSSAASVRSGSLELQLQVDRLQARLDSLEDENKRLHTSTVDAEVSISSLSSRLTSMTEEHSKALSRVSELESSTRAAERSVADRDTTIESLQRAAQQSALDIDKAKNEGEARVRDVQSKLDDKEALVAQLKELIDAKEGQQSENAAALAAKNAEITLLEARVQKAYAELEEERKELNGQVDELRKAGQETIALYEERLSTADTRRYEMEDLIASLEEQMRLQARPLSPSTLSRQASSALEIDNEALREQIQHLIRKASTLEDQLEDARMLAEREEAAIQERILRYKEREDSVRDELTESQKTVERLTKSEEGARMRIEEIEEALRENTVALENARAEIEGLRAEISDLEGVTAGSSPSKTSRPAGQTNGAYELLKAEKSSLEHTCKERDEELAQEREANAVLRQVLEERIAELDATRKKLHRDVTINGLQESSSTASISSSPSKQELSTARDEIKGLKHIVNELQMENASITQRYKVLEAENKLLLSETEQLREDMKTLEENVEQSLLREEQAIQQDEYAKLTGASDDVATLQKTLRDMKAKYEAELEQLRKRISELEMKGARTVHDLNKEISELETLIEAKIYREDELENEVSRLKERLARSQKKSSKGPFEDARTSASVPNSASRASLLSESASSTGEVCEFCDQPGHDAFNCDMLKEDSVLNLGANPIGQAQDLFCEDCESRGHTAENCPHASDVF